MKKHLQYALCMFIYFFIVAVPAVYAQGLENPLRRINSFEEFVKLLLQAVINIGLPIAVLFIVYAGFLFVIAQGDTTKLQKAKDTFFWTIVGVTVFLGSWALAVIVENTIILLTG